MSAADAAGLWEENAEAWTRLSRAGYDVYRDALNTPAFLAMLPPISGLEGLDIGCGEGSNTRKLAQLGARMRGVDIAPTFIRHARETEAADPLGIDFEIGDGRSLPFADDSFDFVTAFMSLMDMPDHGLALKEAYRVLRPGGFLQFSIPHPCFAPPLRKVLRNGDGSVRAVEVTGRDSSDATSRLRRPRRRRGNLVVLHAARRGTRTGCAVPRGPVSPHAEFMGEDSVPGGISNPGVWRAVGIGRARPAGAHRGGHPRRRAVSAHPGRQAGVNLSVT